MNNNDIFKKLRVALQLRDDQIVEILDLVDFRISKGELGNFFRDAEHPKYMECGDQILRNFLNGLIIHLRGTKDAPKNPLEVIATHKKTPPKQEVSDKPKGPTPKSYGKKPVKKFNAKPVIGEKVNYKNGKKKEN